MNILTGYCGQLSLGSGAFMAIGAYSAYKFGTGINIPLEIFTINIPPLPVFWCILLGGLMAAFVGILFGVPSLRIKGLYLAVATLAAQFFFDWVFIRVKWFTNYTGVRLGGCAGAEFLRLLRQQADREISRLPRSSSRCSRCWRRTSFAATSAGNGWRSATWTSPPN